MDKDAKPTLPGVGRNIGQQISPNLKIQLTALPPGLISPLILRRHSRPLHHDDCLRRSDHFFLIGLSVPRESNQLKSHQWVLFSADCQTFQAVRLQQNRSLRKDWVTPSFFYRSWKALSAEVRNGSKIYFNTDLSPV